MKILFLTHRVPYPPDRGDRIRSFNFIKYLSERHEIHLISICFDEVPDEIVIREMKKYCKTVEIFPVKYKRNLLKSAFYLFTKIPLTIPMFYSKGLFQTLKKRCETEAFDLIYMFSSSIAPYTLNIQNIPKIMDFIDVDSEKWLDYAKKSWFIKKWIYSREAHCLRRFEVEIERACQASILVSSREVSIFKQFSPHAKIFAIGNGVEIQEFGKVISLNGKNNSIVFVGVMNYMPNADAVKYFAQKIFPKILSKKPGTHFYIVGKNPTKDIKRLSDEIKNVHVTGFVDNVKEYLRNAKVAVIPLRIARGIQNKVLEAMATGVPVVATKAAMEGIDAQPGKEYLLADNEDDFALKTIKLLEDRDLNQKIAQNAYHLVKEKYTWGKKVNDLEELMYRVVTKNSI
jgi:sugar transferase (PEP-CTERM/EpsH1 system associated)